MNHSPNHAYTHIPQWSIAKCMYEHTAVSFRIFFVFVLSFESAPHRCVFWTYGLIWFDFQSLYMCCVIRAMIIFYVAHRIRLHAHTLGWAIHLVCYVQLSIVYWLHSNFAEPKTNKNKQLTKSMSKRTNERTDVGSQECNFISIACYWFFCLLFFLLKFCYHNLTINT